MKNLTARELSDRQAAGINMKGVISDMTDSITIKAPAKINLALDVTGKRPDGYHDLRMIMQTVALYDELTIRRTPEDEITVNCSVPITGLQAPEQNLVYRAARLLREHASVEGGFIIDLKKNIPAAAGMAGGSTDCAAALIGINRLLGLGLTDSVLCRLGASLGADVPYCIKKGTCLAEGIGEILTPLPAPPAFHVLLAKPDISVSTGFVYKNLSIGSLSSHPRIDDMVSAIKNSDKNHMLSLLENVLETVTIPAFPVIDDLKNELAALGADGVLMSGSGPTVFALFEDENTCRNALEKCKNAHPEYFCIQTAFTDK